MNFITIFMILFTWVRTSEVGWLRVKNLVWWVITVDLWCRYLTSDITVMCRRLLCINGLLLHSNEVCNVAMWGQLRWWIVLYLNVVGADDLLVRTAHPIHINHLLFILIAAIGEYGHIHCHVCGLLSRRSIHICLLLLGPWVCHFKFVSIRLT